MIHDHVSPTTHVLTCTTHRRHTVTRTPDTATLHVYDDSRAYALFLILGPTPRPSAIPIYIYSPRAIGPRLTATLKPGHHESFTCDGVTRRGVTYVLTTRCRNVDDPRRPRARGPAARAARAAPAAEPSLYSVLASPCAAWTYHLSRVVSLFSALT